VLTRFRRVAMLVFERALMKDLTLVILAAGMGSRYGGLKQLDGVGPHNEVIMEYSIFDAMKAGVNRVVFVIRKSFEQDFRDSIVTRLPTNLQVDFSYQEFSDLPAGYETKIDFSKRERPWGTGHAVWAARSNVNSPFIAINADDYYGPQAFQRLAEHLASGSRPQPCMVGFRLSNTLSPSGTVSRGVCQVDGHRLEGILEQTKLRRSGPRQVTDEISGAVYPDNSLVSMNCWGFDASFMDFLETRFASYLDQIGDQSTLQRGEFYLPAAVDEWRASESGEVKVLVSEESWLGVTYPEDRATVIAGLQERIQQGLYAPELWS
jgi:NDP-sugar pyrophosphorylase family protein